MRRSPGYDRGANEIADGPTKFANSKHRPPAARICLIVMSGLRAAQKLILRIVERT
jgi:hypothetical protein